MTTKINTTMTREQFEEHFANNREITYKDKTIGVMDWGDGRFDVLTPSENEQGFETLNPNPFMNACDAVHFAVDYLVNMNNETANKTKTVKKKTKSKEPEYDGPRTVRVFGRDIYIEEDPKASWEDIRLKLVNEYNMPNFTANKVSYYFDMASGILEVYLKFQTKG